MYVLYPIVPAPLVPLAPGGDRHVLNQIDNRLGKLVQEDRRWRY